MKIRQTVLAVILIFIIGGFIFLTFTGKSHKTHRTLFDGLYIDMQEANIRDESDQFYDGTLSSDALSFDIAETFSYSFKSFTECRRYYPLKEFPNATCFGVCTTTCDESKMMDEISAGRARLVCTAQVVLLGFHKCGTSDVSRWFYSHPDSYALTGGYFIKPNLAIDRNSLIADRCAGEQLSDTSQVFTVDSHVYTEKNSGKIFYQDCPGCVRVGEAVQNKTTGDYKVVTPISLLERIIHPNMKFILTMRNPTDRFISEYFYLHKMGQMNGNLTKEQVGFDKLHEQVDMAIAFLNQCITKIGLMACTFQVYHQEPPKKLRSLGTLAGGLFVTYMETALHYIPREQIYLSRLEEYSENVEESVTNIFKFAGLSTTPVKKLVKQQSGVVNAGYNTKPVYPRTVEMLDEFYRPYNKKLARLLNDDRWLFSKT